MLVLCLFKLIVGNKTMILNAKKGPENLKACLHPKEIQ